jgi:ATP-dependent RNA helicase RhlE
MDLVGIANTGTGKTAAFLIPILERHYLSGGKLQALIVVPTRELALQVEKELKSLTYKMNVRSACFIGGVSINRDIGLLKRKPDIIIATPGRLLDLTDRQALSISKTEILVLDEFDRMLDMGFIRDVQKITHKMSSRKQNILFSATIDKTQEKHIREIVSNEVRVKVDSGNEATETVEQDIIRLLPTENKFEKFRALISQEGFNKVLVFAETKRMVNNLARKLNNQGYLVDTIHGNKSQNYRVKALEKFRKGNVSILVATDVAARGIDINDITHVINYQLPVSMDSYIHRIGRTGRAGNLGQAYTFID